MTKGVVLLSGGLDSLVALDIATKKMDIVLALTFDYSQKVFEKRFSEPYIQINKKRPEG